jgi:arylsulfatase A-like enzyme|tara:strand:+ start:14971 stop:16620 length:1650 start_codon:yes stop_codon:yes gene_type:complete
MKKYIWLLISFSFFIVGCSSGEPALVMDEEEPTPRPNFLIITTDDMGYTDLGAFGGQDIPTPNMDQLAMEGVRLTNFHVGTVCSLTRAMLMSGTGNFEAGKGVQRAGSSPIFRGQYGYENRIVDRVATMPERMAADGYHTYLAGKWHLGNEADVNLPSARGFERSFALIGGGYDHFDPMLGEAVYSEDGKAITELPQDFYSTNAYVDKMIGYIESNLNDGQPFIGWFAPTAPHWPLQAHPDWKDRFVGNYDAGYEALCFERMQGATEIGMMVEGADTSFCPLEAQPWNELTDDEKALNIRAMELYAAMTAHLDSEVGRLITYLEESGQLDNTYIIYHNDNGPEGGNIVTNRSAPERFDNSLENVGNPNSWIHVGQGWADAQSAPFRKTKGSQYEGGTRVPAFIRPPNSAGPGLKSNSLLTIMDVLPTIMEIAGVEEVSVNSLGNEVLPIRGKSFAGLLEEQNLNIHQGEYIALDNGGASVLMEGEWRIVRPPTTNDWSLFNVAADPGEANDLAEEQPDKLADLVGKYNAHADALGFLRGEPEAREYFQR